MNTLVGINQRLRFALEIVSLVAIGYSGYQLGGSPGARVALASGAPLVTAVAWATFMSPKAPIPVRPLVRPVVEVVVFGAATAGLVLAGRFGFAWALGVTAGVNLILLYTLPTD